VSEETTFYSDNVGVRVTDRRLIIANATYAMANIASVKTGITYPNRTGPVLLVLIGVICLFAGRDALAFGLVLGVVGVLWWMGQRSTYHVRISSASGEGDALSSARKDYIEGIIQAINEAIIKRG